MPKRALITGITGQDGSYLAELLLAKGYEVHGVIRRASTFNTGRLDHIYSDPHANKTALKLHYGDLSDASALSRLIAKIAPDEIYNLAAQSHVRVSFDSPEYTTDITATLQKKLYLGNLDAKRDWGYAGEYVEAMWLMLQQEKPDDYVIATNETHSVREFLEAAFSHVGLKWQDYVEIDSNYYRPAEVDILIGDYLKAKPVLGWHPKTKFTELVKLMVDADVQRLKDHREGRIKVTD